MLLESLKMVLHVVEPILITLNFNSPYLAFIRTAWTFNKWLIIHYNIVVSRYNDSDY